MANEGGWNKRVMMWDWHDLICDGWPGWAKGRNKEPPRADMNLVWGEGKSSHVIATEFDDIAADPFYSRDFTECGSPFVRDGDRYSAAFWFASEADQIKFKELYCNRAESAQETVTDMAKDKDAIKKTLMAKRFGGVAYWEIWKPERSGKATTCFPELREIVHGTYEQAVEHALASDYFVWIDPCQDLPVLGEVKLFETPVVDLTGAVRHVTGDHDHSNDKSG